MLNMCIFNALSMKTCTFGKFSLCCEVLYFLSWVWIIKPGRHMFEHGHETMNLQNTCESRNTIHGMRERFKTFVLFTQSLLWLKRQ